MFCALIGLFNFGRQHGEEDLSLNDEAIDIQVLEEVVERDEVAGTGSTWMNQKRDQIATQMWEDYQAYIQGSSSLLEAC